MYKEEMSDPRQKKTVMLLAFGILAVCFGIMWFTANRPAMLGVQVGALGGCMISVFLVLRFALRKYTYGADEHCVTLMLQQGSRLPVLTEIPYGDILSIEKTEEKPSRDRCSVLADYCFSYRDEYPKYCIFFRADGKCQGALFQPSEAMLKKIGENRTPIA